MVAFGTKTIKRGWRALIDRRSRRHLSIFRIGWDMLEWCVTNAWPLSIPLVPYFQ